MATIVLNPQRERSVLRRHPWIFSGAINKILGGPQPGETVTVADANEKPIAVGAYSPQSQIRVRVWAFEPDVRIDEAFFLERFQTAKKHRERWLPSTVNAFRLVNSEADQLPGVIVDVYDHYLVLQLLTAGANFQRKTIINVLKKCWPEYSIIERSEGNSLSKEGLTPRVEIIEGHAPEGLITIQENGLKFNVDILKGHKTGFYLDQRDNREYVLHNSQNRTVLNCFAYTGGFGIAALAGGAREVTHIEASAKYSAEIDAHVTLNGLSSDRNTVIVGDVFDQLREFKQQGRQFDLIILDPPKFADSKQQINTAARGYKDINRIAMQLLNPGGDLFTFSCSGAISSDLFNQIVADAASEAKRHFFIHKTLSQAADHAITTSFPEGFYLKGLWCNV